MDGVAIFFELSFIGNGGKMYEGNMENVAGDFYGSNYDGRNRYRCHGGAD